MNINAIQIKDLSSLAASFPSGNFKGTDSLRTFCGVWFRPEAVRVMQRGVQRLQLRTGKHKLIPNLSLSKQNTNKINTCHGYIVCVHIMYKIDDYFYRYIDTYDIDINIYLTGRYKAEPLECPIQLAPVIVCKEIESR